MARVDPPIAADERSMLLAFLDYQRETMIWKADGLNEEQARYAPGPPENSLASLIQHLAYVERWWFRICFAGETDVELPWSQEDPDSDFRVPEGTPFGDVVAFYRSEFERANEIVRNASSLEETSKVPAHGEHPTLRWILLHMIEETARHAGHADITRELVDGVKGE